MKATVTKEFRGQGDHDAHERFFGVGETIYGKLAETAVKDGNAKKAAATEKKPAAKKAKG